MRPRPPSSSLLLPRWGLLMLLFLPSLALAAPASAPAPEPASAMVTVQGATGPVADAAVTINGKIVGALPTTLRLRVGRYLVEVSKGGFRSHRSWLDVKADQPATVTVTLQALNAPPTTGVLLVASDVLEAEVTVDGKPVGKVPVLVEKLAPGKHSVEVKAAGFKAQTREVVLVAGKTFKLTVRLKPSTELSVVSEPPGVEVWVDGVKRGNAPQTIGDLKPGKHVVEGRLEAYKTVQKTVELSEGKVTNVKLTLVALPAKPRTGALRVTGAQMGALVFIDGRFVGKTPLLRHQIVAGPHVITVRKEGFAELVATVEVKAGQIAALDAKLEVGGSSSQPTSGPTSGPASQPQSQPTGEREMRLMDAHGALLLAPGNLAADVSLGFPHIFEARVTTGFFDAGRIGMDGGVVLRTYFAVTEVDARVRVRLLDKGPWNVATLLSIGGGGGPKSRNTFHVDAGAVGSYQVKRWFSVSAQALLSVYTDRLCPENPSTTELSACQRPPEGVGINEVRKRFTSVRVLLSSTIQVPITNWFSVFGGIEVAAAANRRAFTDPFAEIMPSNDPHVYGRVGLTLKR